MFGCLRRLGCLVILLALAAGGYWYWTRYQGRSGTVAAGVWQPVTPADGDRAARAIASVTSPGGRVFANLTPAEAVAYLLMRAGGGGGQIPPSATDVEAMARGDTLHVRAVVPLRDFGGARALGPIAALVSARDTVQLAGTVDVIRPGLAQFRVTRVALRSLDVPRGAIANLARQMRRDQDPALAPNGLPLPLPPEVGDIRIANGRITLYRSVSQ